LTLASAVENRAAVENEKERLLRAESAGLNRLG
jgi:hypothetical protein